ncbi:MAG: hypothetical protein F9K42_12975 [Ignavibacterium sp.]|jgi:hypothetical protein|nr:MAG: hypothetical protein F9K42_12975 [Ignavibacterium sp.]MDX9713713.1 hypothetical protein [Ignavibacteriaceae bacterium]
MSAQTKTRAQKAGKFLGIALFAFLMFFNIKFAVGDTANGDIDLFGLKVSLFTVSSYASEPCGGPYCNDIGCHIWGTCVCAYMLCNPGTGGYYCFYPLT